MYLKYINEFRVNQRSAMIYCNCQGAICLSKNQTHYKNIKYIDIKIYFIPLEVSRTTIKLGKIHTDDIFVDILTKAIPGAMFKLLNRNLQRAILQKI